VRLRPRRRAIPRRRGAPAGLLIVLLGAWGALIPFVGPYFNYQIGTTESWDWAVDRLWLSVLPGAAAVIGGLILVVSATRRSALFGSLLALAGGLWFVAGPSVSMLWNGGDPATGAALGDTGTRVLEWIGFFYGTGALITLLSSYELGFMAALPVTGEAVVAAPVTARQQPSAAENEPAAEEPATTQQPATSEERPPARRRGRRFLRRSPARRS
jgi:hypothetical protein